MSDSQTFQAWHDDRTAHQYKSFTEKTTMYQDLSRTMLEMVDLRPGMRILDLGCGTGVTSQLVLEQLEDPGHLYALDVSPAMLNVARQALPTDRVTFLQADAAHFAHLIDRPLDLILCNSVFWQLHHKPRALTELRQVLAPTGYFVFNAPEPYFIFKHIPRSQKTAILFRQLAAERYGVGAQDLRTIEVFLENHHFEVVTSRIYQRTRSAEESYLFMQLPVTTAWMEPPLDYETRMALLEEAHATGNAETTSKRRWIYFVTRPRRS